jgi:hypothetical protein
MVKGLHRILTLAAVTALLLPVVALADADPASDVLIGQSVFYPYTPAVSSNLQSVLSAATVAARKAHFPIRVALIHAPDDLGAVTSLFDKPQAYAKFLYRELGAFASQHPPLLIVMPNGYGVQGMSPAATRAAASIPKPAGNTSDDVARAGIAAVGKLAAASGHPIKIQNVSKATGSNGGHVSTAVTLVIFALIAVAIAAAVIRYRQMHPPGR